MGFLKIHLSGEDTPQTHSPRACALDTASEAVLCRPVSLPGKHSKQELLGLIEDFRQGLVPLVVPLTLLKHRLCQLVNRHPIPDWVDQQVYLHPYPKELMLRSGV